LLNIFNQYYKLINNTLTKLTIKHAYLLVAVTIERKWYLQQSHTCLKLSNADRIIWCPPLTRQIAASSSSTNVLVLCNKPHPFIKLITLNNQMYIRRTNSCQWKTHMANIKMCALFLSWSSATSSPLTNIYIIIISQSFNQFTNCRLLPTVVRLALYRLPSKNSRSLIKLFLPTCALKYN